VVTKRYNKPVIVRVTEQELMDLRIRAKENNLSLSRYLVEAGLAKDKVLTPKEREREERAIFHVRKIGVNLNQIARSLNRKESVAEKKLLEVIEEQKETLRILREVMASR
jgi:hypothetical protein